MTDGRSDDEPEDDPTPPVPEEPVVESTNGGHPGESPDPEPENGSLDAPDPGFRGDDELGEEPAESPAPVQVSTPANWPLATPSRPIGPPDEPYRPQPEPATDAPAHIRVYRKRRSLPARIGIFLVKAVIVFVLGSVLWVAAYRFIAPPVTFTMIGDAIGGHGINKQWMPLSQIDPSMARAAIGAEDARFCGHSGFDFEAIEAAYERNATGKKRIRGGSTISQQTAKNVFLWQGGGYLRKGLEAWFTVLIEAIWGKARIMEVYLNVAETGIGTYGVNAGAKRYFGHDASRLSAQEAAQIAAVLPLPKKRPGSDPRGYTRRYGKAIAARIGAVRNDKLDSCLR
jgi:monofunctional biosynthetic peptidoglycan transglycosylase